MIDIKLEPIVHREQSRIKIDVKFNQNLLTILKDLPYSTYSSTLKRWHIPNNTKHLTKFIGDCKGGYNIILSDALIPIAYPNKHSSEVKPINRLYKTSDINHLLDNINDNTLKIIIQLSFNYGLRPSEIIRIKPEHLIDDKHIIKVYNAKGNSTRSLEVKAILFSSLKLYVKSKNLSEYIFEDNNGKQFNVKKIATAFKNACNKAHITNYSIQSLRLSFAHNLLEKDISVSQIQHLLGHKYYSTTLNYLNLDKNH